MVAGILSTDPIDVLLGPDGDLDLSSGDLAFSRGTVATAQAIKIEIQLVRSEWFLDLDRGVPWFERDGVPAADAILGQPFAETKARTEITAAILRAPGVNRILTLDVTEDPATRRLDVAWEVKTIYGDTVADSIAGGT